MTIAKIYKRDGRIVRFDKTKIVQAIYKASAEVGEQSMEIAKDLADKVVNILENNFPKTIPMVEDVQDIVEQVLIEHGYDKIAKAYIIYRQKHKELRERKREKKIGNIPYKTIWNVLVWNLDHQCETVDKLNIYVKDKTLPKLVAAAEESYDKDLINLTSDIKKITKELKLLIICGPSSSGKTTTTERLLGILKNKEFVKLNIDNYFYDLKSHIKDSYGDYDFEGPYALDIPLINQHLTDLLNGKTIKVPRYNLKTGHREKHTDRLTKKQNQIILIDSHFGIYDKVTEAVSENQKYKVYLETLCQIRDKHGEFVRWSDIRMLRRMVRDMQFRAYNPMKTVGHWHYVRQGELKNIIPYISDADYIINTSLAYELPILKAHLFQFFPKIIKLYKKDRTRQDAYMRAQRVYNLLRQVLEWTDDSTVPKNSILREFIG